MSVAAGFAQKKEAAETPAATDRTSTDYADDTECRPDAEEGSRPDGPRKSTDYADYTE